MSATCPLLSRCGTAETEAGRVVPLEGLWATAKLPVVGLSQGPPSAGPGLSEELGIPRSKGYAGIVDSLPVLIQGLFKENCPLLPTRSTQAHPCCRLCEPGGIWSSPTKTTNKAEL